MNATAHSPGALRTQLLTAVIVFAAIGTQAVAADAPQTFSSKKYGYSVQFPAKWQTISNADLRQATTRLHSQPATDKVIWEVVYQQMAPDVDGPFSYPYTVCQISPYPNGSDPNEDISEAVAVLTSNNYKKMAEGPGNQLLQDALSKATIGEARYDATTQTVYQTLDVVRPGVGHVKAVVVSHFGKGAIVSIMCYDRVAAFDLHKAEFEQIESSFKFESNFAYVPPPEPRSYLMTTIVTLGLLGGLLVLAFILKKRRSRPPSA